MSRTRMAWTGALMLGMLLAGWWLGRWTAPGSDTAAPGVSERAPLYWVAPMDPSFRSDRPGKSPMGMDLVPVYAEDEQAQPAGTVRVAPGVQHNLGVRPIGLVAGDIVSAIGDFQREFGGAVQRRGQGHTGHAFAHQG